MIRILFLLLITISIQPAFAQDNIIKRNGEEIKAKVVEVGTTEIKYKKFEKQNGPTYVIEKKDVFMIKYEDGTKDILNPIGEEKKTEPTTDKPTEPVKADVKAPKDSSSKTKYSYIDKVREVQEADRGFRFYAGNGWLLGPGLASPFVGIDIRFPRKNVFLRGISIGVRANFKNLEGRDGDNNEDTDFSTSIYGGGITVNYYAPLPIKVVQPYVIATIGVAGFQTYSTIAVINPNGTKTFYSASPSETILPYGGFGVGCNFMISRNFGFVIEAGYFRTSAFNTGIVLKL
ncbi:MAG: hypothetical protein JWO44_952 [Bacteroidetes bacterium]|nr:hypothetical protein [Bacteroidota bacterium]